MHGGHLGHVTSIMSSDFHFLVPESFHTKFGSDQSSNDLDLQYSHTFIYSIRCLLLPTFRSLDAIVSENPLLSLFSIHTNNVIVFIGQRDYKLTT